MGTAIEFMGSLLPAGWPALMNANRDLARAGRDILRDALDVDILVGDQMLGSMAAVPLRRPESTLAPGAGAAIHETLFREHHIEVPIYEIPGGSAAPGSAPEPITFVRISAQRYNSVEQYQRLATVLVEILRH
jgi:isopenicillin-N epimerase